MTDIIINLRLRVIDEAAFEAAFKERTGKGENGKTWIDPVSLSEMDAGERAFEILIGSNHDIAPVNLGLELAEWNTRVA